MELSTRREKILAAVVNAYVVTGEPVGSKGIAAQLGVSSATVRNEMAELSLLGLLEQPHTSAGRVPSQKGYRLYVDRLMETKALEPVEKRLLDSMLITNACDPEKLMANATQALASVTRFAAVSTTPSGRTAYIRAIQFVQTSRRTAMLLLMSSAGTMKNRIFHCDFDLNPEMLRVFFRILNEKLMNRPVADITPAFIQSLAVPLGEMAMLMSSALMALLDVAEDTRETAVCQSGQMNLLFYPEYERGTARRVMDFLERPREVVDLLVQEPGSIRVLIGQESRTPELAGSSVVISRYAVGGQDAGALAVIGPTRMEYAKVISHLSYLSQAVGKMLTVLMREE